MYTITHAFLAATTLLVLAPTSQAKAEAELATRSATVVACDATEAPASVFRYKKKSEEKKKKDTE